MVKKIIASVFILTLIGLLIYNVTDQDKTQTRKNEVDVTGDTSEGTSIVPPNAPEGIQMGEKAPDFGLETLTGKQVKLSEFRGKKVFLNFWATWCGPCKIEMPEMEKFKEAYGDKVEIIAVTATGPNNSAKDVRDFLDQGNFTFTVLIDDQMTVHQKYQTRALPTTYFIGTDGTIQQQRKIGPMTYEFMVETMELMK